MTMFLLTGKVYAAIESYKQRFGHEIQNSEIPKEMSEAEFIEEIDQALASGIPVYRYTSINK